MAARFSRNLCLALIVALSLLLALREEPGVVATTMDPSADGRMHGGHLVIQGLEPSSFDPHFSTSAQDISIERMLWRGLYTIDRYNSPQPAMAAGPPEVSADGRTYTMHVRDGLAWSDGNDLLAEDFVAGIRRTCNPVNAGEYQLLLSNIVGCNDFFLAAPDASAEELQALQDAVGVRAVNDKTLEIKLNQPQVTFPMILSLWMTFPVPVHLPQFASATPGNPGEWGTDFSALAFNGPYMATDYVPFDHLTAVANPHWNAPVGISPTLDTLTIRFVDDLTLAANAFRTGELQATPADTTQLAALRSEFGEGIEFFRSQMASTRGLEMQMQRPPLNNLNVRLALSQAIPRTGLVQQVMGDAALPTTSWIPEVSGGHPPDEFEQEVGFNPQAARDNLAAAGFPNGQGFPQLEILVSDRPTAIATGEFLQESFRTHLNIETVLTVVDAAIRGARFNDGDFDLFPGGWTEDYPDPEGWVIGLFDTGGSLNKYNCSDSEIDSLIAQARFNPNQAERLSQYKEINRLIVTKVCGVAPYWHEARHWLIDERVVGMRENLSSQDAAMAGDWASESWGLTEPAPAPTLSGDTNCDGDVNSVDALFVLRRVANLQPFADCIAAGDVDCDEDIDSVDALGILRHVAALPVTLPPGCPAIGSG